MLPEPVIRERGDGLFDLHWPRQQVAAAEFDVSDKARCDRWMFDEITAGNLAAPIAPGDGEAIDMLIDAICWRLPW